MRILAIIAILAAYACALLGLAVFAGALLRFGSVRRVLEWLGC